MTTLLTILLAALGQVAPATPVTELFPIRAGDAYTYWYEYGESRDTLTMRVLEVNGGTARIEGFPTPAALASGGAASATVTVRVDPGSGAIHVTSTGAEQPLCTVAGSEAAVSTWAGDFEAGVVVPLAAQPPLTSGQVTLARGHGIVALTFAGESGSGEYVLLDGPTPTAQTLPPSIVTLAPGKQYRYMREDLLGRSPWVCDVQEGATVDGLPGVRAVGTPWFDQAGERPLTPRERTFAIDVPGRRWMELRAGKPCELFRFNVTPIEEPVIVPAGRFRSCYRIVSAHPGLEAILAPETGIVSWRFDTLLGPVRFELVRVADAEPAEAPTDPAAPAGPVEPAGPATPVEPAGPATPPTTPTEPAGPIAPTGPATPPEPAGPTATAPAGPELAGPASPVDPTTAPVGPTAPSGVATGIVGAAGPTLFVADASGANQRTIPSQGIAELVCASPDGSLVAWVEQAAGVKRVRVAKPTEAAVDVLSYEPAKGEVDDMAWSPDGASLLFRLGESIEVWTSGELAPRVLATGGRPRWLSAGVVLYETGVSAADEEVGLVRISAAGGDATMLVPWAFDVAASADGSVLAYASPRMDDDPRLFVRQGREAKPLEGSTRFDRRPALSPDGRFLAFVRYSPDGAAPSYAVRLLDRTTGTEQELAAGLAVMPSVAFGADGSLFCTAIPAEGAITCFRMKPPAGGGESELLALGSQRPTLVAPFGAPVSRL